MKLLYIHQYFNFPEFNGGTRSYDLSKKFIESGIDVTIITSSSSLKNYKFSNKISYLEREGLKIWVVKVYYSHKMGIKRRIISFLKFIFFASFKALTIKADIVLATSTPLTIAIPGILKKKISKIPFIFEVRDVWPEGPIQQGYVKNKLLINFLRRIEKYIYNQSDFVVALSTGMKNDILTRVAVPNLEVIPNICEISRFQNFQKKTQIPDNLTDKKIVLYAGTLGPVNDIMYVARIARILIEIDPNIVFLIVGDGRQKEHIIDYCKTNQLLNNNIFFMDPIGKDSLPSLYSKVTMGSSYVWDYKIKWDNSANKFFDTLAAGRPILINYQGWQKDVIEKYNCGYILPYYFTISDIEKFAHYLNNKELLIQQGKNALEAAQQFSLENATQKYLAIFKSLGFNV